MENQEPAVVFDKSLLRLTIKDSLLAPMRDALYLLIRVLELPTAHILCVGAGTGSELIYLAQNFPQWQFTAVEPAHRCSMFVAREPKCGIASRCTFTKVISIHFHLGFFQCGNVSFGFSLHDAAR